MDSFQITVILVATILLIIIFSAIGILTKYSSADKIYPPTANTCPDYWSVNNSGNCVIPPSPSGSTTPPKNIGNIYDDDGNSNLTDSNTPGFINGNSEINFSATGWSSATKSAICTKKKWTNTNNIAWDGVSNYNSCS